MIFTKRGSRIAEESRQAFMELPITD